MMMMIIIIIKADSMVEKYNGMKLNRSTTILQNHIWATSWQNQQTDLCTQRRLRSAWASAQSDQSLRCPPEGSYRPKLPINAQRRL